MMRYSFSSVLSGRPFAVLSVAAWACCATAPAPATANEALSASEALTGSESAAAPEAPSFTFKRVGVAPSGAGVRRITVQIDPEQQARILAANPAVPDRPEVPFSSPQAQPDPEPSDRRVGSYAWYWDLISPNRAQASSGRLEPAVLALARGPEGQRVRTPRLATLQKIADTYGRDILAASAGRDVSPALVLAVISVESAGRADAVSHAGAGGLMQLMPATAERFGVTDRMVPLSNIRGGVAYLDWLLNHFERDVILALAGYNAGEGAVGKHGGVPPYAETRDYVPKVLAAWELAKGLCLTPPQLVSDGCVFRQGVRVAAGD